MEVTLRSMIEKWLPPTASTPVRITRFRSAGNGVRRYVRAESQRRGEFVTLFFFQHEDGAWRVFPPNTARRTLRAASIAA